ncbi:hypothetical protein BBP40_003099 [Aspergillus hancockii]|nr:hypothetical protein BBP40_003099 [Aspergillus hancockii]
MGSNNSSIVQGHAHFLHQVRSEIATKLQELAIIVQSAGEPAVADSLRKISRSEELILSFRETLLSGIHDKQFPKTEAQAKKWFENWALKDGEEKPRLSSKQVERLTSLTRNWTQQNGNDVPQMVNDWIDDAPSKFWGFSSFRADTQLVEYCIADVENIDVSKKLNPIRRRVILLILYDVIHTEEQRLKDQSQAAQSKGKYSHSNSNKPRYLTMAIKSIVERTYNPRKLSEHAMKEKRETCTRLARYGKRWSLFLQREAVLTLEIPNAAEKQVSPYSQNKSADFCASFERANITEVEAEALNAYESIMYDDKYRSLLRKAFGAVYNAYTSQRSTISIRHIHTGISGASSCLAEVPPSQPSESFEQNTQAEIESARKRPRTSTTGNSHGTAMEESNIAPQSAGHDCIGRNPSLSLLAHIASTHSSVSAQCQSFRPNHPDATTNTWFGGTRNHQATQSVQVGPEVRRSNEPTSVQRRSDFRDTIGRASAADTTQHCSSNLIQTIPGVPMFPKSISDNVYSTPHRERYLQPALHFHHTTGTNPRNNYLDSAAKTVSPTPHGESLQRPSHCQYRTPLDQAPFGVSLGHTTLPTDERGPIPPEQSDIATTSQQTREAERHQDMGISFGRQISKDLSTAPVDTNRIARQSEEDAVFLGPIDVCEREFLDSLDVMDFLTAIDVGEGP